MLIRITIEHDTDTGTLKTDFPEDEIMVRGVLDAAHDVILKELERRAKQRTALAAAGIKGWGKIDVRKGDGSGSSNKRGGSHEN
jgi:hypothetical protein